MLPSWLERLFSVTFLPGDIVRWALDGELPFMGESAAVAAAVSGDDAYVHGGEGEGGGGGDEGGGDGEGGGGRGGGGGAAENARVPWLHSNFQHMAHGADRGALYRRHLKLPWPNALNARRVPLPHMVAEVSVFVANKAGVRQGLPLVLRTPLL